MNVSGIQGHLLEVTVVGCNKLKDTEWISRQDPYVCLKYGSTNVRTRTCTDGGKNPTFQERFVFSLIEGLREMYVDVWNKNTLTVDDFIGNGKIQLHKVLSQGFDDSAWPIQTKTGRHAGEVRLILHYANAIQRPGTTAPSAPAYQAHHAPMYSSPPTSAASYSIPSAYPPPSSYPPSTASAYPPPPSAYSSSSPYPSYPSYSSSPYPPSAYPPPPPPSAYPPQSAYPPPAAYPPSSPYYPPGQYPPGPYPPPY